MILFSGPIYDSSGYASVSRSIVRLLFDSEFEVKIFPNFGWSNLGVKLLDSDFKFAESLKIPPGQLVNTEHLTVYSMQKPLQGSIPVIYNKTAQIIHTMFETNGCPTDWIGLLNASAQGVLIPSKWGVDVFKANGVKNVEYMPFYIDTDRFSPNNEKLVNIPGFKFLFIGDVLPRKNIKSVLKAFLHTFNGNKDVTLILKIPLIIKDHIKQFIVDIKNLKKSLSVGEYPKIMLHNQISPESCIPGFINSCDCLVAPSCGEGFGLPQLYAMACEKPVIGVNWSACVDYFTKDNALLVDYEIKPVPYEIVKQDPNFYGHDWAWPSLEHLCLLMKWAYQNQGELVSIGKKARQTVIDKYSYPFVKGLMEKYIKGRSWA